MKVGQFALSFIDAEISLYGFPIRLMRTYDTRQSKQLLDFGQGWSADYQNVRVRESRKLGFAWSLQQQGGVFGQWCVRPSGSPVVTITLPDGNSEQFRAKFQPECTSLVPNVYGQLVFEPVDGRTTSKLAQSDYGEVRWANIGGATNLVDLNDPNLVPLDPSRYVLTTEDGTQYELDQAFGIRKIKDQLGNTITYQDAGIVHSSGTSIQFVRDAQHRITEVVLPDARRLTYRYNVNGDLVGMKDAAGLETTFGYLPSIQYPHYLQDITDARGIRAARSEYDAEGRLVATIDAEDHRQEYDHDIANRTERVKDRNGHTSTYVYDDDGWVLSETNAEGETTAHTYDENGNALTRTDPLLRTTTFTVDPRGNVLTEEDPLHGITTRSYGQLNQLKTKVDAMQRPVSINTYALHPLTGDETGYLSQLQDALGHVTQTPVDLCSSGCSNTGNLRSIIDPLGHRTDFAYDRNGNVSGETDAQGRVTARTYDAMGRMRSQTQTRIVDGQTQTLRTEHTYDAKGQLIQTESPSGEISKSTYNAIGKVETMTDAQNRVTRYTYDDRGMEKRITYPDNRFDEKTYDGEGNLLSQTDRAGRTTKMQYDKANRLVETIHPDATPNDDSDNPRTRNEYDAAGQLTASINELNQRTKYRYDDAGRQTRVIDALLNETTTVYDLSGRRLSTTDALGRTMKFEYDLAGRLTGTVYPDPVTDDADDSNNPRMTMTYDDARRKTAEVDEMGRRTEFGYDALGRLTSVKLAAHTATPFTTTYAYDEQGNKTTQTDAEGRITAWAYDKNGRNLSRKLPMGQIESFGYNAAGERTSHTTFNNAVMTYDYDDLGRIETIHFPAENGNPASTRVFHYNDAGQIDNINDKGAVYAFQYDERDRLIGAMDPDNRRIDYQYDNVGNRTELTTPSSTVSYQYDELNRLNDVVANLAGQAANLHATYTYDPVGNRDAMTQPNGSTVTYQYDRRNRLKNLAHKTAAGVLMLGLAYTVDASGLRTQIDETAGAPVGATRSTAYQYDALKRLTQSTVTGGTTTQNFSEVFTYDKVGNRLTRACTGQIKNCTVNLHPSTSLGTITTTYTYDTNDRLTKERYQDNIGLGFGHIFDYTFDNAGNLRTKKQSSTTLADYAWDIENRLTEATLTPNGAGGTRTTTRYQYDPSGIRRSSEVVVQTNTGSPTNTKTRTQFLIDPNQAYAQVIEDWTASATQPGTTEPTLPDASLQNTYLYGDDLIAEARYTPLPLEAVGANAPGEGGNDPTARIGASNGNSALHYDGLGTTRLLSTINVDTTGAPLTGNETLTDQYAYTVFGEADIASTVGSTTNLYRYTGEQLDPNLGFYYLRARYMNPSVGVFTSMDQWPGRQCDPMSLQDYIYVHDNPVNYIDPSGNFLGILGLVESNFTAMYNRGQEGRKAYRTFDSIRSTLCRGPSAVARRLNGHHALPKFGGGAPGQVLADIPEEIHHALHQLLHYALIVNGFVPPSSKAYAGLFVADRTHRADFLRILRDVTRFVDRACVGKQGMPITPKIRQAIRQFGWEF